jgi:transposase
MEDKLLYAKLLGIEFPWLISRVHVDMPAERIDVWVEEASGARFACAACQQDAPVYDHTPEHAWRHLDTCQCRTYLHASLPRTHCPKDGVKQVRSPWAEPRSQFTRLCEMRMIDTLKDCDVTGVTRLTGTSWDETWGVMMRAVYRGLARKDRRVPARIGSDEKSVGKGHEDESIVCDLDGSTVEYVVDDRKKEGLESDYRQFNAEELRQIEAIAMDM